jgi:tetratricopeptide (TPR) repeat protein
VVAFLAEGKGTWMVSHAGRIGLLLLAIATPAVASDPEPAVANPAVSLRRDPNGRTGISPSWEAIKRGDEAYVAHNLDGALHEYQAAVEAHPQNPVAHYRLGCALIAKAEFKQAQESLDTALRFSKSDAVTAGKVLFVIADLKERQQDYPAALAAWKIYAAFATAHTEVKSFAASAASRQARVTAYMKLTEQSTQVKQRIAERLQAAELRSSPAGK